MIYKTEFIVSHDMPNLGEEYIKYLKQNAALDMGRLIGEKEGFEKIESEQQDKYRLKIVAFNYEKWINFKRNMRLLVSIGGMPNVAEIFDELEESNPNTNV